MFGSPRGDGPSSGNSGRGLNNRFNSYQQGAGSYVPPGTTYAEQQTNVLEETVKTHYEAESTAANVLTQLHTQRHQLQSAHDDVWDMRITAEEAKRELANLAAKNRQKKMRLYATIAALAVTDLLLFLRIAHCRGSFFC